ncbi:hypothetical protein 2AV2_56 [Nodularia phage vB_NpeS-2AV2]|uniref:Uncharacterized protein n=1 Tax=Nodularia phage vB_NpeS-2AV2 TaxID=1777122 RepID=A0A1L2BWU3_9CAUD|nr:hypothetical protein HWA92_gp056 [Nodularia phage vB_NpeS-2AV2]ALY07508.1 hypothetical protein 2AV2_56 [Nodularia phage vB_NpeS-2AV2]
MSSPKLLVIFNIMSPQKLNPEQVRVGYKTELVFQFGLIFLEFYTRFPILI